MDTRHQTEYPHVYVLVDFKSVVVDPDYALEPTMHFVDPALGEYDLTATDLQEHLEDTYTEEWAAFLADHPDFAWESESDLDALLQAFPSLTRYYTALYPFAAQTFLTRRAAEVHWAANGHHYHEKAFIERRKVWRDPVLQSFLQMLYRLPLDTRVSS